MVSKANSGVSWGNPRILFTLKSVPESRTISKFLIIISLLTGLLRNFLRKGSLPCSTHKKYARSRFPSKVSAAQPLRFQCVSGTKTATWYFYKFRRILQTIPSSKKKRCLPKSTNFPPSSLFYKTSIPGVSYQKSHVLNMTSFLLLIHFHLRSKRRTSNPLRLRTAESKPMAGGSIFMPLKFG